MKIHLHRVQAVCHAEMRTGCRGNYCHTGQSDVISRCKPNASGISYNGRPSMIVSGNMLVAFLECALCVRKCVMRLWHS